MSDKPRSLTRPSEASRNWSVSTPSSVTATSANDYRGHQRTMRAASRELPTTFFTVSKYVGIVRKRKLWKGVGEGGGAVAARQVPRNLATFSQLPHNSNLRCRTQTRRSSPRTLPQSPHSGRSCTTSSMRSSSPARTGSCVVRHFPWRDSSAARTDANRQRVLAHLPRAPVLPRSLRRRRPCCQLVRSP